jgi:hypothetical protein
MCIADSLVSAGTSLDIRPGNSTNKTLLSRIFLRIIDTPISDEGGNFFSISLNIPAAAQASHTTRTHSFHCKSADFSHSIKSTAADAYAEFMALPILHYEQCRSTNSASPSHCTKGESDMPKSLVQFMQRKGCSSRCRRTDFSLLNSI